MALTGLAGWTPIRLRWQGGEPCVDWCHTGGEPFTDPFFEQTVERCLSRPFSLLFQRETGIEALEEWSAASPGLRPSGFVFHLSRCGSTLVSQMLAASPRNVVVSEAPAVDAVLRACLAGRGRAEWLRFLLSALGQPRRGGEDRFFVKLTAWSALALPVVREAFPDVPWIFVYRDPVEVIASHARQRGSQMIPAAVPPELFGLDLASAVAMPLDEYCARVLRAICVGAIALLREGGGLAVRYRDLPAAALGPVLDHFEVEAGAGERALMAAAARRDAKRPSAAFEPDSERKQREATPEMREAAERLVAPLVAELEALR